MQFCFYPTLERACGNVSHCPHLGGASIGTLVQIANHSGTTIDQLYRQLDAVRKRNSELVDDNLRLAKELQQVKLELKLERQNKFATNEQKNAEPETEVATGETPAGDASDDKQPKKKGAPLGHPGWYRPTPTHYDWAIDVKAPKRCPHCNASVSVLPAIDPIEHLQEDIRKKLASSDGGVHADETYWTTDGARSYFWVHGDEKFIHFQYDTTRAGQVSRDILGDDFTGTLITDCYSGYFASVARAKQKCLAHVSRKARDWQKLVEQDSIDFQYFADIRRFVNRACRFCRNRREGKTSRRKLKQEAAWLRDELQRLLTCDVSHDKAIQLQALLIRHPGEWLVFLDDPRVAPTNNLAERALRPLVVLRKITFGSRTDAGAKRMAKLMTVAETSRRHGKRTRDIYYELYTRPPDRVLTNMYATR